MAKRYFGKDYKSSEELVALLKSRGLIINDSQKAQRYLECIGYYRLSAYMHPLLKTLKKQIAKRFYLHAPVFESWLSVLTLTRNACCHHARVWNKNNKIIPNEMKQMSRPWISHPADKRRIYYNICIIKYFLDIISPNNDMLEKMNRLFEAFPEIDKAALGFPSGWKNDPLWL